MSNYYYSPTSNSDVKARSFAKSNNHMCTSVRAGASHSLPSKHPSKTSKYSPNNRGLRGQPCFSPCSHLKLEVPPSLGWLMRMVSLACNAYKHRKKHPFTPRPTNTYHNISCDTISNTFLKSINKNRVVFFSLLCSIKVHNMKSWSIV